MLLYVQSDSELHIPMTRSPEAWEVFLSYSRRDNEALYADEAGWISELCNQIFLEHRRYSTEPLNIFFDTSTIKDMDDWRHRVLESLKNSRILLICLSPNYINSKVCRWEYEAYRRHQPHKSIGLDSIAIVKICDVPSESIGSDQQAWLSLLLRSQISDYRTGYQLGIKAFDLEEIRQKIAELGNAIWTRIQSSRRSRFVPGNIRSLNPYFIGRASELQSIHEGLALAAVGSPTVIYGLGGQGKTELALAYAWSNASRYPGGLWVIGAEGNDNILELFAELAPDLGLLHALGPGETLEDRGHRVLAELRRRTLESAIANPNLSKACLVVFDNVSERSLLAAPQLSRLPHEYWLHILVTTRLGPDCFGCVGLRAMTLVPLDALQPEDAVQLIEEHQPDSSWPEATRTSDTFAAGEIVREVGAFTLAVEQIALYLGLHPEIRPVDYLARIRNEGLPSIDQLTCNPGVAQQILHREKVLSIIIDQTLSELDGLELEVLTLAASLPADNVFWPWLKRIIVSRHPHLGIVRPGYACRWITLRRRLEGLRLLTQGELAETARIHRLIAAVIRANYPLDGAEAAIINLLVDPETPFQHDLPLEVFLNTWRMYRPGWPLQQLLIQRATEMLPQTTFLAERWVYLAYQLGDVEMEDWWLSHWKTHGGDAIESFAHHWCDSLHRKGKTKKAYRYLTLFLQRSSNSFSVSIQLLKYSAQLGRHAEADAIARRLEHDYATTLEGDPLRRARFLHSKYFLLHEVDRNADAVEANRIIYSVYVNHHLIYDALITSVNLGDALWGSGAVEEAEYLLRVALARGKDLGLSHVEDIAAICLANVLASNGDGVEANELYAFGADTSLRIGHRWDYLYCSIYHALNRFEAGTGSPLAELETARQMAEKAGFKYLAALADAIVCIAWFIEPFKFPLINDCLERAVASPFPICRLYALSVMIGDERQNKSRSRSALVKDWIGTLKLVQGIKGRVDIIARIGTSLLGEGLLEKAQAEYIHDWLATFVPSKQHRHHRTSYRQFPGDHAKS